MRINEAAAVTKVDRDQFAWTGDTVCLTRYEDRLYDAQRGSPRVCRLRGQADAGASRREGGLARQKG